MLNDFKLRIRLEMEPENLCEFMFYVLFFRH